MRSELIKAINEAGEKAKKYGIDFIPEPGDDVSIEDLIETYGDLMKFVGYHRGFNDSVRGTDTYYDEE